jgi:hypothetical protein
LALAAPFLGTTTSSEEPLELSSSELSSSELDSSSAEDSLGSSSGSSFFDCFCKSVTQIKPTFVFCTIPFFLAAATTVLATDFAFSTTVAGFEIRPPSPFFFDGTAGADCVFFADFPMLSSVKQLNFSLLDKGGLNDVRKTFSPPEIFIC